MWLWAVTDTFAADPALASCCAAVGATAFMPSATMSPMPIPAPAAIPNAIGTAINPTTGVARFDMIKYIKTATIRKPSATSIATPRPRILCGRDYGVVSTVRPLTVTLAYVVRVEFVVITDGREHHGHSC